MMNYWQHKERRRKGWKGFVDGDVIDNMDEHNFKQMWKLKTLGLYYFFFLKCLLVHKQKYVIVTHEIFIYG